MSKTAKQISEEIFYKPATNGKAQKSIQEGSELIENYAKEKIKETLEKATSEIHKLTPFTKEDILSIREEYKDPDISHRDLAKKYGVKKSTIGNIIRRKTWKHV